MFLLKNIFTKTLELLFPTICVGCEERGTLLCAPCLNAMPEAISRDSAITSLFDYKNATAQKAIWSLKYRGNKEIGEIFAGALYDRLLEDMSERALFAHFGKPLLVPIPLSKKRLRERGFNQSQILAQGIAKSDKNSFFSLAENVLYKIKDTPNQVSVKDKRERMQNLRGCFAVTRPEAVKDKSIILIDDVTTTGATLREAKDTLLAAGARDVIAYTIAH